jgi:hypothetical protein
VIHYVVNGQCDLSPLVFSFARPADRGIAPSHRLGAVTGPHFSRGSGKAAFRQCHGQLARIG